MRQPARCKMHPKSLTHSAKLHNLTKMGLTEKCCAPNCTDSTKKTSYGSLLNSTLGGFFVIVRF